MLFSQKSEKEKNKEVVRSFYNTAFNLKNPQEAVNRYVGDTLTQHSAKIGNGKGPFVAYVEAYLQECPDLNYSIKRELADEDMVVVHGHLLRTQEDPGVAVIDIFRLEKGKIVEHWDARQEVPQKLYNRNSMF